jgi:O-antigen/teichoic acid export membrane protein
MPAQAVRLTRLLSWAKKGGFAVLDQALFAGANFLVNIFLARWLEPAQYGAFAVAYAVFLLLATFHTAVLTEPMLVFGAGKYTKRFPQYIGVLMYGHWWVTGIISLPLAMTAFVLWQLGHDELVQAIVGLTLASPLILFMWLVRRAFYVPSLPQWAAVGGALYLGLMLAGMYGLYRQHWLSTASALSMMGIASLAVSLWLSTILRPHWYITGASPPLDTVYADHWDYGCWAIAVAAVTWVPWTLHYTLLAAWVGLEGSAALRAIMNLIMPILHVNSAIAVLLLPPFVQAFTTEDCAQFLRFVRLVFILFAMGALCYWLFLLCFHVEVLCWVYGGRYGEETKALLLAGLTPLPVGVTAVLGSALRAMKRPDQIFWCQTVGAVVTITLGLWLLHAYGVMGAVIGGLASSIAVAVAMMWVVWRPVPAKKDRC